MPDEIAVEEKRNISTEERNNAPDGDFAGPHRSFPILKPADVMAAFHSLGRAKGDSAPIRARIISIAKRKGFPLPASASAAKKEYHSTLADGEKCGYCDMVAPEPYSPFGGATSFAEMEEWSVNQALAEYVDEVADRFRQLMNNIMNDDMMSPAEKASAAAALAKEMQERVASPDGDELEEEKWEVLEGDEHKTLGYWDKFLKIFRHKKAKVLETENNVSLPANRGFKVYTDLEGDLRWLSLSSNAFEDLEKELFTTKALEEAIEHADKTGERGPLLIFHVPSAEVGQCDYQAMAGRFLVESGKFLDTPLGRKAVEYFKNSDEEHQVSIGYEYRLGDEEDGIYEWTRIKERSVCPFGTAANPWTDFKVIGDSPMDARKVEALEKIFGKDLAAGVISDAESRTKELEATTKFKEVKAEEPVTIAVTGSTLEEMEASAKAAVKEAFEKASKKPMDKEDMQDQGADESSENTDGSKKPAAKKEAETPTFTGEQVTQLATLITGLSAQVEDLAGMKEAITELQTQVKALATADDEKISNIISPKWNAPVGQRPTESDKNVITDPEAVKALQNDDGKPSDPAYAYVEQLLQGRAVASN